MSHYPIWLIFITQFGAFSLPNLAGFHYPIWRLDVLAGGRDKILITGKIKKFNGCGDLIFLKILTLQQLITTPPQ